MTTPGELRWAAPPCWPQPPPGWWPPRGWTPPVEWGPAPVGWVFWVPVDVVHGVDGVGAPMPAGLPGPVTILPSEPMASPRRGAMAWLGLVAGVLALVVTLATAAARVEAPAALEGVDASRATSSPGAPGVAPTVLESVAPTAATSPEGTAVAVLASLVVKGRAPRTGYSRDQFGPRWADVDRNGCDTRNDILARDLLATSFHPGTRGCVVVGGKLTDPYTAKVIAFSKARAGDVQIDHVVSLSNAWQTGAFVWSPLRRRAFANDPLNLLAISGPANTAKSEGDAATWLPPSKGYRCAMVARQVAVKAKWSLWATPPERDAIDRILATCPGYAAPTGGIPVPGS
ncbi:MAG TPA: HNH endonuclease family protein [Mycobacteriales bacterium]|nr:HNH endonuclease family protein [Mycobacteriales bacterium]